MLTRTAPRAQRARRAPTVKPRLQMRVRARQTPGRVEDNRGKRRITKLHEWCSARKPFRFHFDRDAAIGGRVSVPAHAPAQIRAHVTAEKTEDPERTPLIHV